MRAEIKQLNRIITMYLDYAEMQAERKQPVYMKEWKEKLDAFLRFNEQEILDDKGTVSMEVAHRTRTWGVLKNFRGRRAEESTVPDTELAGGKTNGQVSRSGKNPVACLHPGTSPAPPPKPRPDPTFPPVIGIKRHIFGTNIMGITPIRAQNSLLPKPATDFLANSTEKVYQRG